jgi:nicotinate-nucleotide pyrophosphorylase
MQQVQSDLRQVRTDQVRQDGEQVRMQDRLSRLEGKIENGFRAMDARFEQVFRTIATNTQLILEAIRGRLGG